MADETSKATDDSVVVDESPDTLNSDGEQAEENEGFRLNLDVEIEHNGPCKRHISVVVPRSDVDEVTDQILDSMRDSLDVPGFRKGRVPEALIRRRFREELGDEVKRKILVQSLEQLAERDDLDPITQPNLELEDIELPDEGDFEYEFDIEVRPEFEIPDYKGLKIERPVREISDDDVDEAFLLLKQDYATQEPTSEPAADGDYLTVNIQVIHDGNVFKEIEDLPIQIRPTVQFYDAEIAEFDKLACGATVGSQLEVDTTVSDEAELTAMRGESLHLKIEVIDVKHLVEPEDEEFLDSLQVDSEEELRGRVRSSLERQVEYHQRQATREQVLDAITESADWDLPEDLLQQQIDNAMRREVLEMQQAGFSRAEIRAKEAELRRSAMSTTRRNLLQHFILDRIAEQEKIEITSEELEAQIMMIALQEGENPRRLRARMYKSGMMENLDAQLRERKSVDLILENAKFTDIPFEFPNEGGVFGVNRSLTAKITDTEAGSAVEDEESDSVADQESGNIVAVSEEE